MGDCKNINEGRDVGASMGEKRKRGRPKKVLPTPLFTKAVVITPTRKRGRPSKNPVDPREEEEEEALPARTKGSTTDGNRFMKAVCDMVMSQIKPFILEECKYHKSFIIKQIADANDRIRSCKEELATMWDLLDKEFDPRRNDSSGEDEGKASMESDPEEESEEES